MLREFRLGLLLGPGTAYTDLWRITEIGGCLTERRYTALGVARPEKDVESKVSTSHCTRVLRILPSQSSADREEDTEVLYGKTSRYPTKHLGSGPVY